MRFFFAAAVLLLPGAARAASAAESVVVARWAGGELRLDDFLRRLALERMKVELKRGTPLPEGGPARAQMAAAVLEGIIHQHLLVEEARRRGLRVSKAQVERELRKFLRSAKVTGSKLREALSTAKATRRELRASVRAELLAQKVFRAERRAIGVTREELRIAREDARWRGEGHFTDAALRERIVARKLSERVSRLLAELRARARVQIFLKAQDAVSTGERRQIEEKALAFYRSKNPGAAEELAAEVVPMGCHTEVVLRHRGRVLTTLGYAGGEIFELRR